MLNLMNLAESLDASRKLNEYDNPYFKNRGRLARKHFSIGAHPAAETPFYIAAASVSARGDAQCVCMVA